MEDSSGSEDNTDAKKQKAKGVDGSSNNCKKNCKECADVSCKTKRSVKRKLKTFTFGKWQKGLKKEKVKKRKSTWTFKLSRHSWQSSSSIVSESSAENVTCICTGYRKTKTVSTEQPIPLEEKPSDQSLDIENSANSQHVDDPQPSSSSFNCSSFLSENVASGYNQHAYEVQTGPTGEGKLFLTCQPSQQPIAINEISLSELTLALRNHLRLAIIPNPYLQRFSDVGLSYNVVSKICDRRTYSSSTFSSVHTQVDYVHYLVPDLLEITNCSFYWGKMDRYKAEKELDKRPEGTFLLRDSAQEEFLFSVSFRRYGRTLHARIEQLNHKFSFDSHDPNVFASSTVCGLIEHYKNPRCCMFFEPMLTIPVHRTFPFSLQHLCRTVISDSITYDNINKLHLPKKLKLYLKEYHYKQRVRVRHLENDN